MHIHVDLFASLAEAVFKGDLAKAEAVLAEVQMIGSDTASEVVRRAKRRARPEMRLDTYPRAKPEVFPVPGHLPNSTLRNPRLADESVGGVDVAA